MLKPLYNVAGKMGMKTFLVGRDLDANFNKSNRKSYQREGFVMVQVTSGFKDAEVWNYIRTYNLPYCRIYDKGYKVVGCQCCVKVTGRFNQPIGETEKEDMEVLNRLRDLGYM